MPEVIRVKPTRGQAEQSWLRHWRSMSRQRRSSLLSLTALVFLLGVLVLYQRYLTASPAPIDMNAQENPAAVETPPEPVEQPAAVQETPALASVATKEAAPPRQLSMPLKGATLRGYAQVWSQTFGDWRWHSGLDLKAAEGTQVKAAAAGDVVAIEMHALDGQTVVIDHGNGLVTRYSGVDELQVGEGARVTEGQVIAKVGRSGPAESDMEPHLHFEVLDDGKLVDPLTFMR